MKPFYRYIFFPVLLIVFLFFFISIYKEVKNKTIAQFNSEQLLIAKSASQGIKDYLGNLQSDLTFLSMFPEIIGFNNKGKELTSNFYWNSPRHIEAITRINANGVIMYTYPENEEVIGMNISYQKHFNEVIQTQKPVISDVFMAVQGYLAIAIHVPVFKDNEFQGSLAVLIAIDKIGKRYLENIKKGESGYALLLSENNIEIFCPFHDHISKPIIDVSQNDPSVLNLIDRIKNDNFGTVNCFHDTPENSIKTEKNVNFYRIPLGNTYWTILISNPQPEVYETIAGFRNRLLLIFIVLLALILVYFNYFIKARKVLKEENKRKIAEKALNESETRLKSVIQNAVEGISITDEAGKIMYWNKALESITSIPSSETIGRDILDIQMLFEPEEKKTKELKANYEKGIKEFLLSGNSPYAGLPLEREYRKPDGTTRILKGIITGVKTDKGYMLVNTTEDITVQKKAELELKQNQNRLIEAERIGKIGNWVYKAATSKIEWSKGMYTIYCRNEETDKVTYESLLSWIHPEDRDRHNKYFERMQAMTVGSSIENLEYRILLPNNEIKWLDIRLECEFDDLGKPLLFFGTVMDITERKKTEQNIAETQFYLTKAQEIGKIGTWKLNIQKNNLFWTDENYKIFGVKPGLPLTFDIFISCVHPEDRAFVNSEWTSKMMTNNYDIEHRLLVNNEVKWVREKAEITFNKKGEPIEAIGFTQDITDRKLAEDEIVKHRNHLEELINERTAELEGKNADLELMNKMFVGRELRMVELKEIIKKLEDKLGNNN